MYTPGPSMGGCPTVAYHVTLLGSEGSYIKDAPRIAGIVCNITSIVCNIAGIDPFIEYHCKPGQILPHDMVQE